MTLEEIRPIIETACAPLGDEIKRLRTENDRLYQERNDLKVEYELRVTWIAEMNKILGYDNSDGMHSEPTPFEIAKRLRTENEQLQKRAVNDHICIHHTDVECAALHVDCPVCLNIENERLIDCLEELRQRVKELETRSSNETMFLGNEIDDAETTIQQLTAMLEKVPHNNVGVLYPCSPDCPRCTFEAWKKDQTK